MSSRAHGSIYFKDRDGNITKTYNGSSDVTITPSDVGEQITGLGAIKVTDTATAHTISISLDKAATEASTTIPNSSIADIIGFLGGTAIPPST